MIEVQSRTNCENLIEMKDFEIECIRKDLINRDKYIDSLEKAYCKEIERLNKRIEDLNTINEEHKTLNGMIRKELQQKENIIKEVREYIEDNSTDKYLLKSFDIDVLLEILDKASDD